jgi:hypothetical protein
MLTARLNAFWIAAAMLPFDPYAFSAEPVPVKTLFVIQVPSLRPVTKSQLPQPESKTEPKTDSVIDQADATGKSDFSIESGSSKEIPVESRAQQIEAMNGTPLLRSSGGARSTSSSTGMKKTIDLLFPPGKSLLSKNPNARRDPLRILED